MGDDENVVHEEVWEITCEGIGGFLYLVMVGGGLACWTTPRGLLKVEQHRP